MSNLVISKDALHLVTIQRAAQFSILPLKIEAGALYIGAVEPFNNSLISDLAFFTGLKIIPEAMPVETIQSYLRVLSDEKEQAAGVPASSKDSLISDFSIIEYVDQIIHDAVKSLASDIHFESYENIFRIRYRIDGHLREISSVAPQKSQQVISRIKIMANLDISERRRPQDGRIKYPANGNFIDIRVSCLPTSFGEKIVLRILDKSQVKLDFESLGFDSGHIHILSRYLRLPYGMILLTGPTGSGKTTTLYTALKEIHSVEKNILTIEDPIEYNIPGINQSSVKPEIGYTFAHALRTFLRQDPDVIMVGEIRDRETAEIGIRAALTGHLVLSTLHTNDSVSAIVRLIDMGIEPYLVASSLKLVIAQRLVRTLCTCKALVTPLASEEVPGVSQNYSPAGCSVCNFTGYRGRIALLEFFEVTEEISEMISKNPSINQLRKKAIETGFVTLKDAGITKIKAGVSTFEEVLRETML